MGENKMPTVEELINEGVPYHVEKREVYFSTKDLKEKYPLLKSHKVDRKKFDLEEDFVGVKLKNLFF